jgi:beta-lactamase class A
VQARRLVAEPKPVRRFAGPIVLAGLLLGLAAFLLLPSPTPEPVPAAPEAVAPAVAAKPGTFEIQEGVPVQATAEPLVPSAPTPDPRVVNEQRLREAVFAPFRSVHGRYGIVVKDLATGYSVTLNETFPFQSASLYKLPVMYEVFKQRDLDMFAFAEEMTIGYDDAAMDLGSLPWPVGTRITIGTALDRMVTLSDNSGAYMLSKKVGTSRINDDMDSMGLLTTWIKGEELRTSARDMARFLEIIARGEALSAETSAEMVHLMARQQVRNRIPVHMPPEAVVANKTGNWEAAAHDVAIVYGPRATFVIALLSDGISDFDALYEAMATASRNVYDVLNDPSFGSSPTPPLPRSQVATYQVPVRLPGAGPSSGSSASRSSGGSSAAPAPTSAPAEKPRLAATAQVLAPAPKPATSGPSLAPQPAQQAAPQAAPKPAEKPAAPAPTPAVKPPAPSLFTPPTKTP